MGGSHEPLFDKRSNLVSTREPIPNARIQRYGYVADIMISKNESGDLYLYIIQQEDSAEVLRWGQELSLARAMQSVDGFLESLRPPKNLGLIP